MKRRVRFAVPLGLLLLGLWTGRGETTENYLGDFRQNQTVECKFTTVDTTGAPTALAAGVITAYKGTSTTTTGVTLTADLGGITGLNRIVVTMTSLTSFYTTRSDFQAVITTGTVAGTSVVGYVPCSWSVQNRFAPFVP